MAALSKAEYLKRYLSKDDLPKEEKIKKRRKIKSSKDSKLKIIDDDIDLKQLKQHQSKGEDLDEAPIVAEVIDERPKHVQQLEQYRKNSRWKVLGEDDEDGTSALDYGVIDKSLSKGSSSKRHDISSEDDSSPKREKFSNNDTQHHNSSNKSSKADDGNYKTGSRHSNQRLDSDSDNSPVRKQNFSKINAQKKGSSSKIWPDRGHTSKVRHDSDSDNSPPRKKQTKRDTTKSTKSETKISDGRNGHQSDSDPSPPRQKNTRHDSDSDHSPKRRHKHSSESDRSPPRRHKQASESDQSPPRKRKQSSESDQSPPRRRKRASESDQSPPRRRKGERHESPKGKKSTSSASQSSSSLREKRDSEPRTRHSRFDSEPKEDNTKKAKKTLGGAKAGLSSAKDMIEEAKRLREKEEKAFGKIDESMLGRNAATVVRDKETGKRKNMAEEQAKNAEEEKRKEELNKQYQLWGKGMKQQANRASALEEQAYEASKPFARHSDDVDLDRMQRCEMRPEDPMLNHYRTKRKKEEEKSGKTAKKELPKYTGTAPPPNRYNLMPGYRWDGVDRSNGFERKIFAQQANKKAVQEIAYKWSTEDM